MPASRGPLQSSPHNSSRPAFSRNRQRVLLQWFVLALMNALRRLHTVLLRCCQCAEDAVEARRRHTQRMCSRDIRPLDRDTAAQYPDNTVVNSRYTVWNFVFKNLYEQFRRPLNFYFLLVAMLQFISIIAPVNPMSTLLPLLFAFSLTAIKEGYDDVKRHRQDAAYNSRRRMVLHADTGRWTETRNCDIRVGDVILLHQDEEIPCDCVVLAAPAASVFMRTDNLDGEIDLKPRDLVAPRVESAFPPTGGAAAAPSAVHDYISPSQTSPTAPLTFFSLDDDVLALTEKLRCLTLHCPPPSAIVDSFEGVAMFTRTTLTASPVRLAAPNVFPQGSMTAAATTAHGRVSSDFEDGSAVNGEAGVVKVSLSHRNLLLQSCLLKNTARAICVAVYTGDDTKCGMNKRPPPVKWAKIDKDVSRYSVFIFVCQLLSALCFGIAGYAMNSNVEASHWYLPPPASESQASFLIYPLRFFLLTTVMIPVSFKFVVDMSKYYMAMSVEWDESMVHGDLGGCKVHNSSILEDLGQIDYILSDKTGTMTQNVMELQFISVAPDFQLDLTALSIPPSVCASPTVMKAYPGPTPVVFPGELPPSHRSTSLQATEVQHFACMLALCNTVEVSSADDSFGPGGSSGPEKQCSVPPGSTVLRSPVGDAVVYQGASPDEVALCCGAAKLNVVLQKRTLHHAYLRVANVKTSGMAGTFEDQEWRIHHVFAFSSERKTMGVIVEHTLRRRILFLVKGADDRVVRMLKGAPVRPSSIAAVHPSSPQETWETTFPAMAQHLRAYARRGLRTLLVAQRDLSRQELDAFLRDHREAELAMDLRQEKLDALRTAMETDLDLIGITAIEDRLQEGVQETISDVLTAGMRMWMLTGDKVETAEQIGLSCGLYAPQDRVVRIVEGDTADTREAWVDALVGCTLPPMPAGAQGTGSCPPRAWSQLSTEERRALMAEGRRTMDRVRLSGVAPRSVEEAPESGSSSGGGGGGGRVHAADGVRGGAAAAGGGVSGRADGPVEAVRTVLVVQGGQVLERILQSPALSARFGELSARCVSVICARTTPSQKAMVTNFVRAQGKMTLSIGDGGNDVAMIQEAHVGVGIIGKEGQQAARAADFAVTQFSDLRPLLFVHGQQAYVRTAYVIKYSFYKSMLISFIQLAYNVLGTHVSGGTFWNSFALTMWNGVYTLPQTLFYCLDRCAPRVVLESCPALYKTSRRGLDMDVKEFFGSYVARGVAQSVALFVLIKRALGGTFSFPVNGYASSNDVNFTVAYTALILSQMITVFLESHSVTSLNLLWLVGMPVFYILTTLAYSDIPALQYYGVLRMTMNTECWLAAVGIAVTLTMPVAILLGLREAFWPNSRDVLRAAEVRRQRALLRQLPSYLSQQSLWVRWLGCTPESPSNSLRSRSTGAGAVAGSVSHARDVTTEAVYHAVV